ncbi:MAG TPA: hypothetical protein VFC18_20060 [Burkholderiales bacterium]|nr:hypothetical protein [Burkholderiales bacterium]
MQPVPRDFRGDHFATRISETDAAMWRIGALAALGVMAITLGTLVLAGGDVDEPANPAPAGRIAYDEDFDSDHTHAPLSLEQD